MIAEMGVSATCFAIFMCGLVVVFLYQIFKS